MFLENINTNVEFTVTDRSSYFKIKFPKTKKANIIVDAFFKKSEIIIIPDENRILGVAKNSSGGTLKILLTILSLSLVRNFTITGFGVEADSNLKILN